MSARFPLSLKILSWLALNLVLIVVVAVAVLVGGGGVRGFLEGPVLERLQLVGDQIAFELRGSDDFDKVLSHYAKRYDLQLTIYANEGEHLAGSSAAVPEEILTQVQTPPLRRPPSPEDERRPGDRRSEPSPDRRSPPPQGDRAERPGPRATGEPGPVRPPTHREGEWSRAVPGEPLGREGSERNAAPGIIAQRGGGAFIQRAGEPEQWWAGVRIPVPQRAGRAPRPGTLLAMSDSAFAFGSLLDLRPVLWGMGLVVIISILFWLPLVLRMTNALNSLMKATGQIAQGRFETRVAATRWDEIGALGQSINRMAGRLDTLVNGQKKFLADVAHELGSPIGRLQVASSILEERVRDELKPQVADVKEEVDQMSELLGELLVFTKAGLQAREAKLQPVVLGDAIEQAVGREAGKVAVERRGDPDLVVMGDAALLVKVLGNLVRNAVRYGGSEVRIEVATEKTAAGDVQLEIKDNGPGVPVSALDRLGEPFFRPDAARTRKAGGTGLGLSIVRESIAAMHGRVTFANVKPHGFGASIVLPAADLETFTSA